MACCLQRYWSSLWRGTLHPEYEAVVAERVCRLWAALLARVRAERPLNRRSQTPTFTSEAAVRGHLEVLKWAREDGCPWDAERSCAEAPWSGRLEVAKWARENGCPWDSRRCASTASKQGHTDIVQWIEARGNEPPSPKYRDQRAKTHTIKRSLFCCRTGHA
jgi:hypothetical protein